MWWFQLIFSQALFSLYLFFRGPMDLLHSLMDDVFPLKRKIIIYIYSSLFFVNFIARENGGFIFSFIFSSSSSSSYFFFFVFFSWLLLFRLDSDYLRNLSSPFLDDFFKYCWLLKYTQSSYRWFTSWNLWSIEVILRHQIKHLCPYFVLLF